jgi:hypothetical protein
MTPLQEHTTDLQFLIAEAAKAVGMTDPVAFNPGDHEDNLRVHAVRRELVPLGGALLRDWTNRDRLHFPGVALGARVYTIESIRYVRIEAPVDHLKSPVVYRFAIVERADYLHLFQLALRYQRISQPLNPPPVMQDAVFEALRLNTLGFLEREHLQRIRELGGRPRRGLLFTGPPGNGKTSACRWLLEKCTSLGIEARQVTPDDYRAARHSCNPAMAVRQLFEVSGRGVVFFDDLDIALRDRSSCENPEDQAVFLGALDGIKVNEGAVYVFTTNLPVDRLDVAFKRPGRIDVVLTFPKPDALLRERLVARWHEDVRSRLDCRAVVAESEGMSFAELEELKNLLVLNYLNTGAWDWNWAKQQFEAFRADLMEAVANQSARFAPALPGLNGDEES